MKLLKGAATPERGVEDGEFQLPEAKTVERLDELATAKLSEIIRRSTAQERGWRGYDKLEVAAARELLVEETSASAIER
jgi:ER membrane protein complex subunit 2